MDLVQILLSIFIQYLARLQTEYDRKKQQSDMKKKEQQKSKRKVLQKQFEEDMNQFKNDGLLHVPTRYIDITNALLFVYIFLSYLFTFFFQSGMIQMLHWNQLI